MTTRHLELVPLRELTRDSIRVSNEEQHTNFRAAENVWRTRFKHLLRGIGLGFFTASSPSATYQEEKKVVIEISKWVALVPCCVHILPVAASIILIWLNIMGSQLTGPSSLSDDVKLHLQFVAKAHELTIIASTASIVFSIVRYQLLFGSGIPLGLIGSGMSFAGFSYFW